MMFVMLRRSLKLATVVLITCIPALTAHEARAIPLGVLGVFGSSSCAPSDKSVSAIADAVKSWRLAAEVQYHIS